MNKLLGMLNLMLRDDEPETGGGEGVAAPADEGNIYGKPGKVEAPSKPGADDGADSGDESFADDGGEPSEDSDDGESFGDETDVVDDQPEDGVEEVDDGSEEQEGEETGQPKTKIKQQVVQLDPQTIAELRRAAAPKEPVKQEGGESSQMTPEQIKQMLNPVVVTADTLKSFGFADATPEQVQGFQQFSNSIVKNAASIARVLIQQKEREFSGLLQPLMAEREQSRMQQARDEFYGTYAHLKKYDKVMRAAANEVEPNRADGSPKSRKEIFKEVASKTIATLASIGVKVTIPPKANLGADGKPLVPKPNKTGGPSGRSGGGQVRTAKPNNPDADIYKR